MNQENQNLQSLKRRGFEVCLAIYRLTKLFPAGEVLINQLREAATKIVVLLAAGRIGDTIKKIEEIKIYLALARAQNWVRSVNFDLLRNAYSLIGENLTSFEKMDRAVVAEKKAIMTPLSPRPILPRSKKESVRETLALAEVRNRRKKIMDYFIEQRQAKLADLSGILGQISERTIRNDLAELISKKLIRRLGNNRTAYYILAD